MDTRHYSDIQERRVAKNLNERMVIGSGATPFLKGDVIGSMFIECKTKVKPCKSFTIKREWLEKAKKQAFSMGRQDYALTFSFDNKEDFYVLEPDIFESMYSAKKVVDTFLEIYGLDIKVTDSEELRELKAIIKDIL